MKKKNDSLRLFFMVYIKRKQQNRNKDKSSFTKNKKKKLTH